MSRYHRSFRPSRSAAADIRLDELADYQASTALLPADIKVRNAQAKLYEAQLTSQESQSKTNELQNDFEMLLQAAKAGSEMAQIALDDIIDAIAAKYNKVNS